MQTTLEAGDSQWNDEDYASHKEKVKEQGGDSNEVRKKMIVDGANDRNRGRNRSISRGDRSRDRHGNYIGDDDDDESPEMAGFKRKAIVLPPKIVGTIHCRIDLPQPYSHKSLNCVCYSPRNPVQMCVCVCVCVCVCASMHVCIVIASFSR